jgi:hypothetical protein
MLINISAGEMCIIGSPLSTYPTASLNERNQELPVGRKYSVHTRALPTNLKERSDSPQLLDERRQFGWHAARHFQFSPQPLANCRPDLRYQPSRTVKMEAETDC